MQTTLKFFNHTIGLQGEELAKKIASAESQEGKIMSFFMERPGQHYTPYEVLHKVFHDSCPKSSVSRALRQLVRRELLVKTDQKSDGEWGIENHTWKLA